MTNTGPVLYTHLFVVQSGDWSLPEASAESVKLKREIDIGQCTYWCHQKPILSIHFKSKNKFTNHWLHSALKWQNFTQYITPQL